MRTQKALKACADWLVYCLSIGWSRDELDDLEALLWKYRDDNSELKKPAAQATPPLGNTSMQISIDYFDQRITEGAPLSHWKHYVQCLPNPPAPSTGECAEVLP